MHPEPKFPDLFPVHETLVLDHDREQPGHKDTGLLHSFEPTRYTAHAEEDILAYERRQKRGQAAIQSLKMHSYTTEKMPYNTSWETTKPLDTILSLTRERTDKHTPTYLTPQQNTITNIGALANRLYLNNLYSYKEEGAITAEDLPEIVLPILDFIELEQPHIVIGCDRGARLLGLAVHATWRATRPNMPFPTLDGRLHFARISKSEDLALTQAKVDAIVAQSKTFGAYKGNTVAPEEQLRVLFLDDWINSGGTRSIAMELMKKHGARTFFGVMGQMGGADVSGSATHNRVNWHDKSEEIGVNYRTAMYQETDGTYQQTQTPVVVKRPEATLNRLAIHDAARRVAEKYALAQAR